MARPPAGPMGNSPRDVRDDAVGIPAENVNAPEPPRWPPKRKKITGDTFHAKASGSKAPKRADRPPTFRRGGMVNRFASGGSVEDRREDKPGENKNDPFAKQNLRRGGGVKKKYADGGEINDPFSGASKARQRSESTEFARASSDIDKAARKPTALGRAIFPEEMELRAAKRAPFEKKMEATGGYKKGGVAKHQGGGSVFPLETPEDRGRREGRKIIKQMPFNAKQRSESTERAGATDRLGKDFDTRVKTGKYDRTYDEVGDDIDIRTKTGEYKRGGGVK
jgi:hypothetical protein